MARRGKSSSKKEEVPSDGNAPAGGMPLPGYGLIVNHMPDELFPSALDLRGWNFTLPLTTLREFTMLRLMNQITDKPEWHRKVFDDAIANKWKTEALQTPNLDITQSMVDWCIDELRYKAKLFEDTGIVSVYTADVVKSDVAVPQDLQEALKEAVKPLEDVSSADKDWHPGSDEKVLDLVHPSLFPLVYGRSRILPDGTNLTTLEDCVQRSGEGVTIPVPLSFEHPPRSGYYWHRTSDMKTFSTKFQWLPCDVDISGDTPKITSYINNLHPQRHPKLYNIVERIIGCAIPLWNATLTHLKTPTYRIRRIEYSGETEQAEDDEEPSQNEGESDEDFDTRYEEYWEDKMNIPAKQPEPGKFAPPSVPESMKSEHLEKDGDLKPDFKVNLKQEYGATGLQVIVKLANIHLTPEKPEYEGGTWHVEGQLNEHICSTALYYYDSDNITSSALAFRQQVSTEDTVDVGYEQNYHRWLSDIYGCDPSGPTVQYVGTVNTTPGRLLTFPNVLQHQVQPFSLTDRTKPGYRKILALFLVDPNIRVISTAHVPCQRQDWWREVVVEKQTQMERLPLELRDEVYRQVDFPMSMEEAKSLREELMDERKSFVIKHDQEFQSEEFSLCEH